MADCSTTNIPQRVCDLEIAVDELASSTGHPPVHLDFGSGANSWNDATQQGYINVPSIPSSTPEVVVVANDVARAALAPQKLNQLLLQTVDPDNGGPSLWAATGLGAGQWALKSGRYNRAALPTLSPDLYAFNWLLTDNWVDVRIGPSNYTFSGLQEGLKIRVYIIDLTSAGWPAPTWPAGIIWGEGSAPFVDGLNTIIQYDFDYVGGKIYGRATIP